ncbi:hypothetical protein D3C87_2033450 [compost metagenome]
MPLENDWLIIRFSSACLGRVSANTTATLLSSRNGTQIVDTEKCETYCDPA